MHHFMNQNVINNPLRELSKSIRDADNATRCSTTPKALILVGDILDSPDSQFTVEVALVQLLSATSQVTRLVQLILPLAFPKSFLKIADDGPQILIRDACRRTYLQQAVRQPRANRFLASRATDYLDGVFHDA